MPIKPEPGKVYRRGDGRAAHIMGPTRGTDYTAVWSLEADHYNEDGRQVHREWSDLAALTEQIGEHSDGNRGEGWSHLYCTACFPHCSICHSHHSEVTEHADK